MSVLDTHHAASEILIGMPIYSLPGHKQAFSYLCFQISHTSILNINFILKINYYDHAVIIHTMEFRSHM